LALLPVCGEFQLCVGARSIVAESLMLKHQLLIFSYPRALVEQKYRLLFAPRQRRKPGPKGPSTLRSIKTRSAEF
jgi:hypothetical protein